MVRSAIHKELSKVEQNDVLDDNSSQSGKILYEISWEKQVTGDYITY